MIIRIRTITGENNMCVQLHAYTKYWSIACLKVFGVTILPSISILLVFATFVGPDPGVSITLSGIGILVNMAIIHMDFRGDPRWDGRDEPVTIVDGRTSNQWVGGLLLFWFGSILLGLTSIEVLAIALLGCAGIVGMATTLALMLGAIALITSRTQDSNEGKQQDIHPEYPY